jgi:formylglycine-generating enzyme required for sulfatase activity/streptogramin lyase
MSARSVLRPLHRGLLCLEAGVLAVLLALVSCARPQAGPALRLFPTSTRGCGLHGIAAAPDGSMWFTEENAGRIGHISAEPPYRLEEFPLTPATGKPGPIAVAPDGTVWVAELRGDRVIGLDPREPAARRAIPLLTTFTQPRALVSRSDGTLLLAQTGKGLLAAVETPPPGRIHEIRLPVLNSAPGALALTSEGRLWFALQNLDQIGRLDPNLILAVEVRSLHTTHNGLPGAVATPGGDVWFTFGDSNRLARVTSNFVVTEFPLPTSGAFPRDPVVGKDGAIWFLEAKARRIGRMEAAPPYRVAELDLQGVTTEPRGLAVAPDGALWFLVPGADTVARFVPPRSTAGGQSLARGAGGPRPMTYQALQAPVPSTSIDVIVDQACALSVDRAEVARLRGRESRVLVLPVGRHVITATADSGGEQTRVVDLWNGVGAMMVVEFESKYLAGEGFVPAMPRLRFAPVPAGEFVMGAGGSWVDEVPAHPVRISRAFEMATTEATQAQWLAVMGKNPTDFENLGDDRPMQKVSWDDAQEFLERLGRLDPAHHYRLPTEAEWEYAARAGAPEPCPSIDETMGWFGAELFDQVHPVAHKTPNAWGLYDMVGNAGEWCSDWYDPDTYRHDGFGQPVAVDPAGPDRGTERVYRGFRPSGDHSRCWAAVRSHSWNTSRVALAGFRVVREAR